MLVLDDNNFGAALAAPTIPLLLIFRSSFCGPSAWLDPLLDQLIEERDGQIEFADIDVEECPKLTREMQIKGTPTLVLLKDGEPLASQIGTMTYADLTEFVDKAFKS